jgi:flavodoxin I
MEKLGLIYGSDTGATESVIEVLEGIINKEVEVIEVCNVDEDDFLKFDFLILGIPTWYDGDLQSDWEDYYDTFKTIDFTNKIVAIFGLGDQIGYGEYFVDGIGILAQVVIKNGGKIIGNCSTDGYDFMQSKAEKSEGIFYGLPIDEDNQHHETENRIEKWWQQLKEEFYKVQSSISTMSS